MLVVKPKAQATNLFFIYFVLRSNVRLFSIYSIRIQRVFVWVWVTEWEREKEGASADIKWVYRMMCLQMCTACASRFQYVFTHICVHLCVYKSFFFQRRPYFVIFLFHRIVEITYTHAVVHTYGTYDRTEQIDFIRTGSLVLSWLPTRAVSVTLLIEVGAIHFISYVLMAHLFSVWFYFYRKTEQRLSFWVYQDHNGCYRYRLRHIQPTINQLKYILYFFRLLRECFK